MQRFWKEAVPPGKAKFQRPYVLGAVSVAIFVIVLANSFHPFSTSDAVPAAPEPLTLARNLAQSGTFANPFLSMPTGPTAHIAPLFPAWLAFVIHFWGAGPWGAFVLNNSAAVALATEVALFPLVAKALGLGIEAGIIAAVAAVIAQLQLFFAWETNYLAVLLECLTLVIFIHDSAESRSNWFWIAVGGLWGIAILTSPVILIPFVGWLLWSGLRQPRLLDRRALLIVLAIPIVILAPWIVRNYSIFGKFIFIRGNLGLELATSNNSCAAYAARITESTGCYRAHHPNINRAQAATLAWMGESAYNSARMTEARHWIAAHPGAFLRLTGQRLFYFWFPSDHEDVLGEVTHGPTPTYYAMIYAFTILSLFGLWRLWKKNRAAAAWCSLWLAAFPLVYYFVLFLGRYRYPILWMTFLAGGYAIVDLASTLRRSFVRGGSRSL